MKKIYFIITLIPLFLLLSCETAMEKNPKYQKPVWLEGKIFTVATTIPDISQFTECIERSGLDKILDKSGLYTLMAPTNEAFAEYLTAKGYQSIDDIDSLELKHLVEMHIVLNPWSKDQMRQLNQGGWIESSEDEPQYTGFKRETALLPANKEYKVREVPGQPPVITPDGNSTRLVYAATNKYAPLFYSEYMDYVGVQATDFEFYYDRPFESSEIYYAGAKLLSSGSDLDGDGINDESYAAENGYVYIVDRVIEPLQSADELLFNTESGATQYTSFGNLINKYAIFNYNEAATYAQEGAQEGLEVDDLYDIEYANLGFSIYDESTYSTSKYSIAYHHAIFPPSNAAYAEFEKNVLGSGDDYYGSFLGLPSVLRDLTINSHMSTYRPYYPSQAGALGNYYNFIGVRVDLSDVGIIEKKFASNSTFVGVDKVLMPKIFSSVAAPVLLRNTYSSFYIGILASNVFTILSNLDTEYSLFAISDLALDTDSSLLISYTDDFFTGINNFSAQAWNRSEETMDRIQISSPTGTSIRSLIKGQITLGTPKGICEKEFLRTLSGFYISFNTSTGFVWGGDSTTYGYMGDSVMELDYFTELSEDFGSTYGTAPVNGKTYSVDHWMQFPKNLFAYSNLIVDGNRKFYDLIEKAGLKDATTGRLNFITEGESMTVLVPSDSALIAYEADSLPIDELQELIKTHFITGVNLFTDNILKYPLPENYFTVDGKILKIGSAEPDKIDVYTATGSTHLQIEENDLKTNIMYLGWDNGNENDGNTLSSKEGVGISVLVHLMDDVINPDIVF